MVKWKIMEFDIVNNKILSKEWKDFMNILMIIWTKILAQVIRVFINSRFEIFTGKGWTWALSVCRSLCLSVTEPYILWNLHLSSLARLMRLLKLFMLFIRITLYCLLSKLFYNLLLRLAATSVCLLIFSKIAR